MSKYQYADPAADCDGIVRLSSNEFFASPSDVVMDAITTAARRVNRYPRPGGRSLRDRLASRSDVPATWFTIGNGSNDLLLALADSMLDAGDRLIHGSPSFSVYPIMAHRRNGTAVAVPLVDDGFNLDAMVQAVDARTKLVVICSPNNPTGQSVSLDAVEHLATEVGDGCHVILDEAYIDFQPGYDDRSAMEMVARCRNVIVVRTFSKAFGLAGLRIGYAICANERTIAALNSVRQPFPTNVVAEAAAYAALSDEPTLTAHLAHISAARDLVTRELRTLGCVIKTSDANFVLARLPERTDEATFMAALLEHGVAVRSGSALGIERSVRVSIGSTFDNAEMLSAATRLLSARTRGANRR